MKHEEYTAASRSRSSRFARIGLFAGLIASVILLARFIISRNHTGR